MILHFQDTGVVDVEQIFLKLCKTYNPNHGQNHGWNSGWSSKSGCGLRDVPGEPPELLCGVGFHWERDTMDLDVAGGSMELTSIATSVFQCKEVISALCCLRKLDLRRLAERYWGFFAEWNRKAVSFMWEYSSYNSFRNGIRENCSHDNITADDVIATI